MRRSTLILVGLLLLLGGVAALVALLLHNGMSAAATPTKMEEFLARNARRLATPSNARATVNPMQPAEASLRDARLHFADHCAVCHGNDGSGQTMLGRGMYPKPPDLRLAPTQNLSDGELFWIIENGVRFTGMPSFAAHHGDAQDSCSSFVTSHNLRRQSARRWKTTTPKDRMTAKKNSRKTTFWISPRRRKRQKRPPHPSPRTRHQSKPGNESFHRQTR